MSERGERDGLQQLADALREMAVKMEKERTQPPTDEAALRALAEEWEERADSYDEERVGASRFESTVLNSAIVTWRKAAGELRAHLCTALSGDRETGHVSAEEWPTVRAAQEAGMPTMRSSDRGDPPERDDPPGTENATGRKLRDGGDPPEHEWTRCPHCNRPINAESRVPLSDDPAGGASCLHCGGLLRGDPPEPETYPCNCSASPCRCGGVRGDPPEEGRERPRIVCLCGSTRFIDVMAVAAWEEEKRGRIALSCHLLPGWYTDATDHLAEEQGVADALDALHLRKVEMADEVLVIDVGGYIGESTAAEIAHAERLGKPVRYLSKEDPEWFAARVRGVSIDERLEPTVELATPVPPEPEPEPEYDEIPDRVYVADLSGEGDLAWETVPPNEAPTQRDGVQWVEFRRHPREEPEPVAWMRTYLSWDGKQQHETWTVTRDEWTAERWMERGYTVTPLFRRHPPREPDWGSPAEGVCPRCDTTDCGCEWRLRYGRPPGPPREPEGERIECSDGYGCLDPRMCRERGRCQIDHPEREPASDSEEG